jgi:ATP-dependent Clp protease adapter protein ClpS
MRQARTAINGSIITYPLGSPSASPRQATETPQVEDLGATDVAVAPPWMTVLHNCDCHTFEDVVKQLMKAIACSEERGWELAWQVHNTGKAVVKVGAETECVRVGNILAAIGLVVTVAQS